MTITDLKYRLIFIFITLLFSGPLFSQDIGNEWINFNQEYYKITLDKTGIYRMTYQDLNDAGFPVTTVDPRRIQLFYRGSEVAIIVDGQLDAVFDEEDFIEFFGEENDGTLDRELYVPEEAHPHPYYNLYSDTSAYFLTWRIDSNNGKRISDFKENNVTGIPAEVSYSNDVLFIDRSSYSEGRHYPLGNAGAKTYYSHFDFGEGWTGPRIAKGNFMDYELDSIFNPYEGTEKPHLELLLAGRNNLPHNIEIFAGPSSASLRSITTVSFNYYDNKTVNEDLEWTDIGGDGKCLIRVQVNGIGDDNPDFVSVSYIKLGYTNQFVGNNQSLQQLNLQPNAGNKSYVEISQISAPHYLLDITDREDIVNIGYNETGTTINAIIPSTNISRSLLLTNSDIYTPIIRPVTFNRINPSNADFLIISHPEFHKPGGDYNNPTTAYASYRSSTQGGSFHTLLLDIGELFNQFSYGESTPLAIYRFCRYMVENGNPEYLLLIGRSLSVNQSYYRQGNTVEGFHDYVPTGGYPGSDIVFTSGLNGATFEPGIPTGRITAKNSNELAAYLDKLKEAELFDFKDLWKKDLIHLSGGATPSELERFAIYVEQFKWLAEGLYLGGDVTIMSKQTTNEVELINISKEVNEGVIQITFFGHSGVNITDIDIGFVSDPGYGYDNKGKYPFMLINGCSAGNIFANTLTFGEDWIITADKGAIGVSAHSGVGYETELKRFSDYYYATAYGDSSLIHQSLGKVLQATSKQYLENSDTLAVNVCQVQQLVYQGDPAVRLFAANKPDYAVSDEDLWLESFDGQTVTALSDSFSIAVLCKNYGRGDTDSIDVIVKRTLIDGTEILYDPVVYPPVLNTDTLLFTIKSISNQGSGINRFDVVIDPADSIPELDESNNTASKSFNIPLRGTQNLYPYDLSIANNQQVILISQSNNLLSGERNIVFELDTSALFNSPFHQSQVILSKDIAEWEVSLIEDLPPLDSTVYYWRTKFEEILQEEDSSWTQSSFTYIQDGPTGWAQLQQPQQQYNETEGVYFDDPSGTWKFIESRTSISVTTYGANHPEKDYTNVELYVNDISFIFNTRYCTTNSINALAFDEVSTNPYLVLQFVKWDILDRRSCGRRPQVVNNFLDTEVTGTEDYLTAYIDAVSEGDFILLFSIGQLNYESWPSRIFDKLKEVGVSSSTMEALKNGEPMIILGQKGAPEGTAIEIIPDPTSEIPGSEQELMMEEEINGKYTSGSINSTLIGPVLQWGQFYNNDSNPSLATNHYRVSGMNNNGDEVILMDNIQESPIDLSGISTDDYRYIRLYFNTENETDFIPAQFENWLVTYEDIPEGVLLLADGQTTGDIEVQEGEKVLTKFTFRNISDIDFTDSLLVSYSIRNITSNNQYTLDTLIAPPSSRDITDFDLAINTIGKIGENDFRVVANASLKPEKIYNNNILELDKHFIVFGDDVHPILDVSFDGRYILDGEIVSPSPLIKVVIKDENKILIKEDTADVDIYLTRPCEGCQKERISFTQSNVTWTAATEEDDFYIEYKPENFNDGIYILEVQAADASGNNAGSVPYRIRFEIINESQITHFFPYPNPFSSSTRFIFTLTGSEIPDEIKIQIMTVSGRVVREITQDEIGSIRIGNNITDFAWDGRDEFGDQLANGVYLYRVIVKSNGQDLDRRGTSADKGFKNNFGKLYLLR